MLGEGGLHVSRVPGIPGCQLSWWMVPSVPGQWPPGPWSLEVESPLAVPEGPGSLSCHIRLGVSNSGSAFCSLLRSPPP